MIATAFQIVITLFCVALLGTAFAAALCASAKRGDREMDALFKSMREHADALKVMSEAEPAPDPLIASTEKLYAAMLDLAKTADALELRVAALEAGHDLYKPWDDSQNARTSK